MTPDRAASEGHSSNPENGLIRLELKFEITLIYPVSCLLNLEFDNSVRVDFLLNVTTDY
jgi:hypothetical protein